MKVLVCIPCLLTGGTEVQTLSLVGALVAARHEVVVACYFEYSREMVAKYERAGARVVLLSASGGRKSGVIATFRHLWNGLRPIVKTMQPDVAHVQYMAPGAIPIMILRCLGVRSIVATAHTAADIYPSLRMIHWLNRRVLSAFQCITGRAERSFFGSSQLFYEGTQLKRHDNHFTIYNALPEYIKPQAAGRTRGPGITIGVVSRLEHIKGMDLVVPAFAEVRSRYPDVELLIAGDGSQRRLMERQVADSGLGGCVTFVGRQPQEKLQEIYGKIDILLMPSRSEGFGLTAIEGMACGCAVVASRVGGLPEVVADGATGLLHEPECVESIVDAVSRLIDDIGLRMHVSRCAVNAVVCRFSYDVYKRQIACLYDKLK